jgi:hypothetical protein
VPNIDHGALCGFADHNVGQFCTDYIEHKGQPSGCAAQSAEGSKMDQKIAKSSHLENTKHDLKLLAEPTYPVLPKPGMKAKCAPVTRVRSYAELARASKPALESFWYIDTLKDLKELAAGARPCGTVLVHNRVQHTASANPFGARGFRAWVTRPTPHFVACPCGWQAQLGAHYRVASIQV